MNQKTISKWDKQVLVAKIVINRFLGQAKREIRNERISESLRGKSFVEKFKILIK